MSFNMLANLELANLEIKLAAEVAAHAATKETFANEFTKAVGTWQRECEAHAITRQQLAAANARVVQLEAFLWGLRDNSTDAEAVSIATDLLNPKIAAASIPAAEVDDPWKAGVHVVKNPANWQPSDFDAWGSGVGIGEVVDVLDEGETIDVRWPSGRSYHKASELLPSPKPSPASGDAGIEFSVGRIVGRIVRIEDGRIGVSLTDHENAICFRRVSFDTDDRQIVTAMRDALSNWLGNTPASGEVRLSDPVDADIARRSKSDDYTVCHACDGTGFSPR